MAAVVDSMIEEIIIDAPFSPASRRKKMSPTKMKNTMKGRSRSSMVIAAVIISAVTTALEISLAVSFKVFHLLSLGRGVFSVTMKCGMYLTGFWRRAPSHIGSVVVSNGLIYLPPRGWYVARPSASARSSS